MVVPETCGDFLKVEYEDVPEHFIYGYIKREDLVCTLPQKQIVCD